MSFITVDGILYRSVSEIDEAEAAELGEHIKSFTLEGERFWKQRFESDSGPDAWNSGMYGDGDETAPFFTEAFLYNLLGKDEARSVLGILRRLCALAGVEYR